MDYSSADYPFEMRMLQHKSCKFIDHHKVGSINAHRQIYEYLRVNVLPSFGFFLGQIVSRIGHVARYVNSLLTPFGSPVSRGTETLSNLQFVLKNNLKIWQSAFIEPTIIENNERIQIHYQR